MSSTVQNRLSVSKRELLLGALATAVTLATPQSRLLAASRVRAVKLALADGNQLEVHKEAVFLLGRGRRRPVRKGVFSLASGGRIEVQEGNIVSAAMGPGDAFVKVTWIEVHSPPGRGVAKPGAVDWLKSTASWELGR